VDRHQADAVAAFFEDWRFWRVASIGSGAQLVHEAAERNPSVHLVLARQLGDVQHVSESLLAAAAQHEADVSASRVEQALNRFGDRDVVPARVQAPQQLEGVGDWRSWRSLATS
jgi:hypothetical protein